MKALERIKEIEAGGLTCPSCEWPECTEQREFLFKAFKTIREIAIQVHHGEYTGVPGVIDEEFEKRMGMM